MIRTIDLTLQLMSYGRSTSWQRVQENRNIYFPLIMKSRAATRPACAENLSEYDWSPLIEICHTKRRPKPWNRGYIWQYCKDF